MVEVVEQRALAVVEVVFFGISDQLGGVCAIDLSTPRRSSWCERPHCRARSKFSPSGNKHPFGRSAQAVPFALR
jgi:hypothetical protein